MKALCIGASIICSTDLHTAGYFGDQYLIIPDDDSHLGVCWAADLWGCFPKITNSQVFDDISYLNEALRKAKIRANSYANLLQDIRAYDLDRKNEKQNTVESLETWIDFVGVDSLEEALIDALDPKASRIQHLDASSMRQFDDREVWVSGRVIQLEIRAMSDQSKQFFNDRELFVSP